MTQEEMKIELEELAVRFSEGWHEGIKIDASDIMLLNKAAQALAQTQEPVAWGVDWDAWNACSRLNSALEAIGDYAHDKSTGPAEPDALWEIRTMAYDAIEATTPPQRTWVGLSDDERDHLAGLHLYAVKGQVEAWIEGVDDFAQAIEAKLKEKNCL